MEIKNCLKLTNKEYIEYHNGKKIEYVSNLGKECIIGEKILKEFISNDNFFEYFNDVINDNKFNLTASYNVEGNRINEGISITCSDALYLLSKMEDLNEKEKNRLEALKDRCSIKRMREKFKDHEFKIEVDGKYYTFKSIDLLKIFFSKEDKFQDYIKNSQLLGVDIKLTMYAIRKLIKKEKILERYHFPRIFAKRYHLLKEQQLVDYQAINAFDENDIIYDFSINDKLKKSIYKGMNKNYSDVEKSVYLYIKLCKMFSYDPEFYLYDQKGANAKFHEDISRLSKITSGDDLIVCYEFNALYSKLLEELNIKYRLNIRSSLVYGGGHANLDYIVDKFIVFADSVTSISTGDLVNVKLNQKLEGLKCLNKSRQTREEFDGIVKRIYKDIVNSEDNNLDTLIREYRFLKTDYKNVSLKDRIKILLEELNMVDMKTMDCLGYLMRLKRIMFTSLELDKHISFVVLKKEEKGEVYPCVIVTINQNDNISVSLDNEYLEYRIGKDPIKVSKEEIKKMFFNDQLKYLRSSKKRIPGIDNKR